MLEYVRGNIVKNWSHDLCCSIFRNFKVQINLTLLTYGVEVHVSKMSYLSNVSDIYQFCMLMSDI